MESGRRRPALQRRCASVDVAFTPASNRVPSLFADRRRRAIVWPFLRPDPFRADPNVVANRLDLTLSTIKQTPMNVIYFNPDEMRADLLGCYGHPLARTPNFDRLAREGVRFDQCHVQHTVCTPSRCSFMTGWYPHVRGHRTLWHCLQADEPNTLKYLKQAGYETHWMGKNDLLAPDAFADSVTQVHTPGDWRPGQIDRPGPDSPHFHSFLFGPLTDGDAHDRAWLDKAVTFLQARRPDDPPFMLFLATSWPHCPYVPPEPWASLYRPEQLPALRPADLPDKPEFQRLIRQYRKLDRLDDHELRRIMAAYLGMISYVDHLLGLLLDALDQTGLADSTAVFAFSDHGDWAGDFGLVEKWPSGLDDCLTRIPLIVRLPGAAAGHVVAEPVECFDIMPTTLELAGVDCQHTHFARSLLPQLHGQPGDPERAVFAEGGYDPHEPQCFEGKPSDGVCGNPNGIYFPKGQQQQQHPESVCRATMIRTATHKLIRRTHGEHEFYDLQVDPLELVNRHADPACAETRDALASRLLDWYIHTSDVVPWTADPRDFPPTLPRP